MTRNTRIPKLCKRRSPSTGKALAYATFNGRTVSFGPEGPLARQEYDAFLAAWLANGRRMPEEDDEVAPVPLAVGGLIDLYLNHLRRKHDARWIANNYPRVELPTRPLRELFGPEPACEFSPKRLAAVRKLMVNTDSLCRREVNARVQSLRRLFTWGCAEELLPMGLAHGLAALEPLRHGDYGTHEGKKVHPVAWEAVAATLPHLSRPVRAAVELLWLCGGRPSEVLSLRPKDIDRSEKVWSARIVHHKNSARGKRRELFFGPKAQRVLAPLLLDRPADRPLFSPAEAVQEMECRKRRGRKTPLYRSHAARYERERALRPRRQVGEVYTAQTLARAIERGVAAENLSRKRAAGEAGETAWARLERWHPYQLRHAAATRIRKECGGLEAVRVLLGHSSATMSEVYAEVDLEVARKVMEKAG